MGNLVKEKKITGDSFRSGKCRFRRRGWLFLVFCFGLAPLVCERPGSGKDPSSDRVRQLRAQLEKVFQTADKGQKNTPVGLWRAQPESLTALLEKKYLKDYRPRPNEPGLAQIRRQIRFTDVFMNILGSQRLVMFTIGADGKTGGFRAHWRKTKKINKILTNSDSGDSGPARLKGLPATWATGQRLDYDGTNYRVTALAVVDIRPNQRKGENGPNDSESENGYFILLEEIRPDKKPGENRLLFRDEEGDLMFSRETASPGKLADEQLKKVKSLIPGVEF